MSDRGGRSYAGQATPDRTLDELRDWEIAMRMTGGPLPAGRLALAIAAAKYRHALAEGAELP